MAGAGAQHLPPANIGTVPSPSKTDGDKKGGNAQKGFPHLTMSSPLPPDLRERAISVAIQALERAVFDLETLADANTESDAGHIADMYIGIIQLLVCPVCIPSRVS